MSSSPDHLEDAIRDYYGKKSLSPEKMQEILALGRKGRRKISFLPSLNRLASSAAAIYFVCGSLSFFAMFIYQHQQNLSRQSLAAPSSPRVSVNKVPTMEDIQKDVSRFNDDELHGNQTNSNLSSHNFLALAWKKSGDAPSGSARQVSSVGAVVSQGDSFSLGRPVADVIALNIHKDNCPPCEKLTPMFTKLMESFEGSPVAFASIDVSTEETKVQASRLAEFMGIGALLNSGQIRAGEVLLIDGRSKRLLGRFGDAAELQNIKDRLKLAVYTYPDFH